MNFFAFEKIFIFKEILLCSWNFFYIQGNFSYSEKFFYLLKTFYIQRKSLCLEKILYSTALRWGSFSKKTSKKSTCAVMIKIIILPEIVGF